MAHTHDDSETYYLDQFCLIGISGVLGAVCLALYFWKSNMLNLMLGTQFHLWVMASGFLLVGMALVRSVIVWRGAEKHVNQGHDCSHEHGKHDHAHDSCEHTHGHDHDDHTHNAVPIRYALLLVPVILFLIGFPSRGPQAQAATVTVDTSQDSIGWATLVGCSVDPRQELVVAAALTDEGLAGIATPMVEFKTLERISATAADRKEWKNKLVRIKGQFAPSLDNGRVFNLVRFRMGCCAADALRLDVPMICTENLTGLKTDAWIDVKGRVSFQRRRGTYHTVLKVPNREAIVHTEPDPNPWAK